MQNNKSPSLVQPQYGCGLRWNLFIAIGCFIMAGLFAGTLAVLATYLGQHVTIAAWATLSIVLGTGSCALLGLIFGMIYLTETGRKHLVDRGAILVLVGVSGALLAHNLTKGASAREWGFDIPFIVMAFGLAAFIYTRRD
jgi:uncharacterized membrane protein